MELFFLGVFLGGSIGIILMALFTLNTIDKRIEEKKTEEKEKITQINSKLKKYEGGKRK